MRAKIEHDDEISVQVSSPDDRSSFEVELIPHGGDADAARDKDLREAQEGLRRHGNSPPCSSVCPRRISLLLCQSNGYAVLVNLDLTAVVVAMESAVTRCLVVLQARKRRCAATCRPDFRWSQDQEAEIVRAHV